MRHNLARPNSCTDTARVHLYRGSRVQAEIRRSTYKPERTASLFPRPREAAPQQSIQHKMPPPLTQKGRLDQILPFLETHPIPTETVSHFAAIPWTNKYLSNPAYRAIPTYSRVPKPNSSEDHLFAQTANTPNTIPHILTLQRTDFAPPPESPKGSIVLGAERRVSPYAAPECPDCIVLVELGASGLDGHAGLLHGGMAGAILDETLGLMASLHLAKLSRTGLSGFTASLNITYRAPVSTPSTVVVRNWVEAREGRKWVCRGQIVDGDGVVLTEAEALLVSGAARGSL